MLVQLLENLLLLLVHLKERGGNQLWTGPEAWPPLALGALSEACGLPHSLRRAALGQRHSWWEPWSQQGQGVGLQG